MYSELEPYIMLTIVRAEQQARCTQAERIALLRQRQAVRCIPSRRLQQRLQQALRACRLRYGGMWRKWGVNARVQHKQGVGACRVAE
jgi:hypothetical protein